MKSQAFAMSIIYFCFLMLLSGVAPASPSTPLQTNINELVKNPALFNNKLIQLRAIVTTDYRHYITLNDDKTPLALGVALYVPKKISNKPSIDALMNQILTRPCQGMKKQVSATFIGIFEYHPGKIPNRTLKLTRVSDVKATWVAID